MASISPNLEMLAWCKTTDAYSLREIIEKGELSPPTSASLDKPLIHFSRRPMLPSSIEPLSAKLPVVIMVSSEILKTCDRDSTAEIAIEQPIPFSPPMIRALILPEELQEASFSSSFLAGLGRDIDIRFYAVDPTKSASDYRAVLEMHYQALLEKFAVEDPSAEDMAEIAIIRGELSKKFIELIASDPRFLEKIEWRELEYLLAAVFERLGFIVELTPGSKDGGKDIVLSFYSNSSKHTYFVEIKHWRSGQRVGKKPIREFLKILVSDRVSGGLYLSTCGYCSNAIESLTEIERKRLRFGTGSKMVAMCKTYVKANAGLWTPDEPTQILYADTT